MSCCLADVKVVSTVVPGGTVVNAYYDLRSGVPVEIDQATYDALVKVRCPEFDTEKCPVCIQLIGNTDPTLIESGLKLINTVTTFDVAGVPTVEVTSVTLHQADGTDVTATHEETACPSPIVIEQDFCVE